MRILLVTPPMTQLNTPYPATAYLTGFLRQRGYDARQADPALELVLRLLSEAGLQDVHKDIQTQLQRQALPLTPALEFFLEHAETYKSVVGGAVRFLQGRDPSLAMRIVSRSFLPEGPRFRGLHDLEAADEEALDWAFGSLGTQDKAKYIASLFIDDLADVIRDGCDPRFELSRYGEKLAASAPSFGPMAAALAAPHSLVDRYLVELTKELIERHKPDLLGLTVPFPGNVYGALRIAQTARELMPEIKIVMGGGYVNTELRSLQEPQLFDYVDYVTLDDGEKPFLCLLEYFSGKRKIDELLRTFYRDKDRVVFTTAADLHDIPLRDAGTPTYDGLPIDRYLSLCEMLNPMHRIWSDGRWNKLTLAHGCYWRKCSFCDISLDYIGRYDEIAADLIVDRIEAIIAETGQSGFHFVDEAAPPKVMLAMAKRLIERRVNITWWGNVRFEKTFTPAVAEKLAQSGLIAVSGGLEVASDRLLKLMNKGVTVEQVARVTRALTDAGILVHAYLMYGFPTQTEQETIDALERVRQLFAEGCVQSAYWHRFSVTVHSPIGLDPKKYGIEVLPRSAVTFAENDLDFYDPTACDHDTLGHGLRKALYNYMHGIGLEEDVRFWFDHPAPKARVSRRLIATALQGVSQ